ncbi:MAG: response regulator [Gemmatimonadaceae bacterium]
MSDPTRPAPQVLVIDDESTIRMALRRFFSRLGWTVDEAASGEEALVKLLESGEDDRYRLIICDLRMPGLSGIDLHDRIAAERPRLLSRLIFSTGDLVSEEVAGFIETTHCLVLEKPFELSSLLETVQRISDRKDDLPEARSG